MIHPTIQSDKIKEIEEVEEVAKVEDDQLILVQKMEEFEVVRCFVLIYNSNNLIIGETKKR